MLKLGKQQDRTNARRYRTGETFLTPEAIMAQYYDQYGGLTTAPAEYMFNKALEVAPNDLPTRQAVAVWALEKGKPALAKEQVKAILKIEASDRRYEGSKIGRELSGLVALWEKDWPAAEKCFQEVLDESRTDLAARNNIALALVEQNEQNDQEDSAKKRPELDKKLPELDKKPSELDKNLSELDKKLSELDKKPSELDKKPSELDKKPSELDKKRREVDKKPRALEYALANYNEHKDNPEVLSTLGWVYYRNERFDDAGTVLEQAVKTTPGKLLDHPDLVTYVAHVLHHRGRDEEAKVYLQEILQNDRPFSMRPEAMKLYEEVRDAKPDAKRVKALTDQLRVEKGPSAAGLQFDKAVRANPGEPAPYVILGKFALRDRRLSEATMDFEKAKQLLAGYTSPQGKEAAKQTMEWDTQSGIARVAESREDWREAEPRLRDLLKVDPENLYTYQRLARALFQQGKVNEAYDMLKKGKQQDIASAKKNKTREQFLTPEAIMAQYYDQYDPTSGNAEVMFKRAIEAAPGDLPTRQVFAVWALEKGRLALAKEQAEAILNDRSTAATWAANFAGWSPCGRRTGRQRNDTSRRCVWSPPPISSRGTTSPWRLSSRMTRPRGSRHWTTPWPIMAIANTKRTPKFCPPWAGSTSARGSSIWPERPSNRPSRRRAETSPRIPTWLPIRRISCATASGIGKPMPFCRRS